MLLRAFIIVASVHLIRNVFVSEINYCDKKLCPYQGLHVACNQTKSFGINCKGEPQLEDITPYINLILNEHNYYRNLVASGKVKCFPPAARMPILEWDNDLAETAEYNVRSCVFAHDYCRSTSKFHLAGQNIFTANTTNANIAIEIFITEAIFLWFDEQFYADTEVLLSYRKTSPQVGHFTTLVNDRQNRVGCAFLNILQASKSRSIIFTCNYSSTNIRHKSTYIMGKSGSKCKKRSKEFKALCEDPIDPNIFNMYNEKI